VVAKGKLTDVELRDWVRAKAPLAGKSDGAGLTFTLSKAGTAAWVLRYRAGGKPRELTLGRYPDLTLAKAREKAAKERVRVTDGSDPAMEKRRARLAKAAAQTFRELAEDYMRRAAPALAMRSQKEMRRYLDKDILPRVGGLAINDVTPAEIIHLVETIAVRSTAVARNAFDKLSIIFAHGAAKRLVAHNPCVGLKVSAIIGAKSARARLKLTTDELRSLLTALPDLTTENALAVRVLLVTAVRKNELLGARWIEFDLDGATWTIPAERSKSRTGFVIPLPPQAVTYFRRLKTLAGASDWVLPRRASRAGKKGGHMNAGTLNLAMDNLKLTGRSLTPHDLRSTTRSYLTDELGISVVVAERVLNHTLGGLVAVYDKSDYLPERRRALELWASHLDDIENGRDPRVRLLRAGVAA
jgi:integrase